MKYLVFVAVGGAAGAVGRYSLSRWVHSLWQGSWPLGTLLVNLSGCVLMGVVFVLVERSALHPDWRNVLMVGFLGAFTTYSTFSLETVELWQAGEGGLAIGYMVVTTLGCVLAAATGIYITRALG